MIPRKTGGTAGGTTDHATLTNLVVNASEHIGDADTIWAFDSGGNSVSMPPADARNLLSVSKTWPKTTAPTVNDDSADGYAVGDWWNDSTGNNTYIADSVAVGAADWRSLLEPNAVLVEVVGGQIIGWGGIAKNDGTFHKIGNSVVLTAEDDTYGEVISGDTITIAGAGLVTGDTGAVQSNSRRYKVALADLGIVLSSSNPKTAVIKLLCDSITDNSEARAGTIAACAWLGVGSTSALIIGGVQRPPSGSGTYQAVYAKTSATSLTGGTTSAGIVGGVVVHEFPNSDNGVYYGALDADGGIRSTGTLSTGALGSSQPDTLVLAFRASAGASGVVFNDLRVTVGFAPAIANT